MGSTDTLYCETCGCDVEVLVVGPDGEYEGLGVADQTHVENCDISDPNWYDWEWEE